MHYQIAIRRKDGLERFVVIDGAMAEIGGKRTPISVVQDVTERVVNEQVLRESELRLRGIFENSLVGIVITHLADGRIDEVNDTFLSLSGYSRDEVIGRSTIELGVWKTPGQRAEMIRRVRRGESLYGIPATLRMKSGAERDLLISARQAELHGDDYVIVTTTDITELNQAKAALEKQETRLQAVIDAHPIGMALFDKERRLIRWNCRYQELLQYPDDLLAQTDLQLDDLIRFNHSRGDYPGLSEADVLVT